MSNARDIVDRYYTAFTEQDFDAMRELLHDDVYFQGPVATVENAEDFVMGIKMLTKNMQGAERKALFGADDDVCQVYDMLLIDPPIRVPVAQWITVRDGKIASVRAFSDARPFLPKS